MRWAVMRCTSAAFGAEVSLSAAEVERFLEQAAEARRRSAFLQSRRFGIKFLFKDPGRMRDIVDGVYEDKEIAERAKPQTQAQRIAALADAPTDEAPPLRAITGGAR